MDCDDAEEARDLLRHKNSVARAAGCLVTEPSIGVGRLAPARLGLLAGDLEIHLLVRFRPVGVALDDRGDLGWRTRRSAHHRLNVQKPLGLGLVRCERLAVDLHTEARPGGHGNSAVDHTQLVAREVLAQARLAQLRR